jgi:hypothetical protein
MPLPKFLATHVTTGYAAILSGLTRQHVHRLCEDGNAPGAFYVSDGRGRGFWCVQLDSSGSPLLDRKPLGGHPRLHPRPSAVLPTA